LFQSLIDSESSSEQGGKSGHHSTNIAGNTRRHALGMKGPVQQKASTVRL